MDEKMLYRQNNDIFGYIFLSVLMVHFALDLIYKVDSVLILLYLE